MSRCCPQVSLKDTIASQRSLEVELASSRSADSTWEFKTKELEGRMRALEKENEMLRQKVATPQLVSLAQLARNEQMDKC